jgi:hypothetical protein
VDQRPVHERLAAPAGRTATIWFRRSADIAGPVLMGLLGLALAAAPARAAASQSDLRAVPTYESAGLYWTAPGRTTACRVRFRQAGEAQWRPGLDLWYDARGDECRGSLVHLRAGTRYQAELGLDGGDFVRKVEFTTWADRPAVARTVRVPAGRETLEITQGGTADGYVVYDGRGARLDAGNAQSHNVHVRASYVIVRGLVLRGAREDAIRIGPNVTDVVIEDNDIGEWGRAREDGGAMDLDSGIRALCRSCPEVARVTIQRNRIHDPRHGANSWSEGHPQGPQAITFSNCGGNHVIRDNHISGGEGRKYNDAIGGEDNFSLYGFPNADSDIYRNHVADAWDDGIEAEGGNRNVRIWGNHIDNTATGIATTVTAVGPVYIFRNVYDRSRFHGGKPADEDSRQPFFKAGSAPGLGDGRRYIFHNTMLQSRDKSARLPLGAGLGISGTGSDQLVNNTWSMNNIYRMWKDGLNAGSQLGRDNVFRNDLSLGPGDGNPKLARDGGRRIPNFNDDFAGKAPDIGAKESN